MHKMVVATFKRLAYAESPPYTCAICVITEAVGAAQHKSTTSSTCLLLGSAWARNGA